MKNLEYYLIALGVLIATAGQAVLPVAFTVIIGVLIAAFAGNIATYIRKESK
jgi:hypothetical protein